MIRYFVIILLVFVAGCVGSSEKKEKEAANGRGVDASLITNPVTLEGERDKASLPEMIFDNNEHDFGQANEGDTLRHIFTFKNTGKGPLVISSAESSCGCTIPYYPKEPVLPGESGEVKVEFNTKGKTGAHVKEVVLFANTQPNKQIVKIKADIVPEELVN